METLNKTVGQIVREDYRAAGVFEKYGIDFCCAGKKELVASCIEKGLEPDKVIGDLENITEEDGKPLNYGTMTLTALADHIVNTHHKYVEETGPVILKYLEKVKTVHGKHNPELYEIYDLFHEGLGELVMHMRKEELVLFPCIKRLEKAKTEGMADEFKPHIKSMGTPISVLMGEHEAEGDRYKKIAGLAKQYVPPAHACNTFRVSYAKLQEFERDLHLHIHLENNILFPKAIEMEGLKS